MKRNSGTEEGFIRKDEESVKPSSAGMSRRKAVRLAVTGIVGAGSGVMSASPGNNTLFESEPIKVDGKIKIEREEGNVSMRKVRYEEMLPADLEIALKEFPVAYVPMGSIEWHGRHLPYGNDALKAHGILIRTAQEYGGVVVPPTYWGHMGYWQMGNHPGLSPDLADRLFIEIFTGLVRAGFKVVIGVTGHDVKPQQESLQKAVDAISAYLISPEGPTIGFAMMEGSLNPDDPDVGMDHAAKWETSILMALRPELVDMKRIEGIDQAEIESGRGMNMKGCGISGKDPRIHASKEAGEKAIGKIAGSIGQKAQELLVKINWKSPELK
jgi:creatinine amidohydrolase